MIAGNGFRFSGTASRKEAWTWQILLTLAGLFVWFLEAGRDQPALVLRGLAFGFLAICWLGTVSALVRRAHDTGRSGWWIAALAVPLVNIAVLLFFLVAPPRATNLNRWSGRPAYLLASALLGAIGVVIFLRAFWAPYWIPQGSMKPTLLIGDYILVLRTSDYAPRPGDVVVFRHPGNGADYVKRVIGVPGDVVQMKEGVLQINGAPVTLSPAGQFEEVFAPQGAEGSFPRCENGPVGAGGLCAKSRFQETLPGGRRHFVLNILDGGFSDDTGTFTVPPGRLFVMGDNRDNSLDSRFAVTVGGVGLVPVENVVGCVQRILFSWAGRSPLELWTWRAGRYFMEVE